MTHEQRVRIAQELARLILKAYGDAVLAVFVTSSTAKGLDREHSDLELTTVVRDGVEIEDKSYVHQGILIEIEYPQESNILKELSRVTRHWPVTADSYRHRLVLFERDGWLRRLDKAIEEQDAADLTRGLKLATMTMIECRDKVRNALPAGDELNIHVAAFWLAENAAEVVFFLNRRYMSTTSRFYTEALDCAEQPPEFRRRVEILLGITPVPPVEIARVAEHLCADLVRMVESRGIAVSSEALVV